MLHGCVCVAAHHGCPCYMSVLQRITTACITSLCLCRSVSRLPVLHVCITAYYDCLCYLTLSVLLHITAAWMHACASVVAYHGCLCNLSTSVLQCVTAVCFTCMCCSASRLSVLLHGVCVAAYYGCLFNLTLPALCVT